MPRLSIGLLGTFSAELDGEPVVFAYGKTRAILAYLAMESDRQVRREKLAGLIWPDQPQQTAQEDLRQALSRLRKSLRDPGAFLPFILSDHETVQLNPQADVQVDAAQFKSALDFCANHSHRHSKACPTCAKYYAIAANLFRGDFMEGLSVLESDLFEDWIAAWRDQFHAQIVETLGWLADYHQRRGNDLSAWEAARRQSELEPFSEETCLRTVRILAQAGKTDQALSHFRRFQKRFEDEFSQPPSPSLFAYVERLRSGSAQADVCGKAAQGLPVPLIPLIGRQVELNELDAWLADPTRRLITILGPGGIGKSRLALAAAQDQACAFSDGVIFLNLNNAHSRAEYRTQTARAMGFSCTDEHDFERKTGEALKAKDCLLILDGFENILDAAEHINRLLQSEPNLVILVTSRERLNLPGEWIFSLGGLPCPAVGISLDIDKYSAVELFVLQARQTDSSFALTPENRDSISHICRLVGGMPLAIGLASSWVNLLPCAEIACELQRGLDLLATTSPASDPRQVSIRAAFEQSWKRLSDEEKRVFRQLTVFRGGFDRLAAEAVTGAALETLASLANKSFVRGSTEGRYHLHDLLLHYGAEKLFEAGETDSIRLRHFEYYLGYAEKNEARWLSRGDTHSFFWLVKEQDNLQAALEWSDGGDPARDQQGANRLRMCMHLEMHKTGVHVMTLDLFGRGEP